MEELKAKDALFGLSAYLRGRAEAGSWAENAYLVNVSNRNVARNINKVIKWGFSMLNLCSVKREMTSGSSASIESTLCCVKNLSLRSGGCFYESSRYRSPP